MHVFSGNNFGCESDSYIAWPAAGDFPIQYLYASDYVAGTPVCAWSINLGSPYLAPVRDQVVVKLTRLNDNKTWIFDRNTAQLGLVNDGTDANHLAVDDTLYGMGKAIIFRPKLSELGTVKDGDRFKVAISGIKTTAGVQTTLEYPINFFDLNKYLTRTVTFNSQGGSPVATISLANDALLTAPAAPTRSGYKFVGWYTGTTYANAWDFTTDHVYRDITLYARWIKSTVSGVVARSAGYNSIKLTWIADPGADYYDIYRATSLTGTYAKIKSAATGSTYTNGGLVTNQIYYYKIRAYAMVNGLRVNCPNISAIVSAKPVPSVPASFTVAPASATSIKVVWNAVNGANGYEVWRASSQTGIYARVKITANTSWINLYLTNGKTYYYKVRAYRLVGTTKAYGSFTVIRYTKP
jgi:uncharacterized repeat protein (TIGR02543 family)